MKGFRKAALPIISVLIAAIISLTSVTFAWFTYGNEAKVEQITVDVESAGGLQMSLDGAQFNWTSSVNINDLIKVADAQPRLTPVSTDGTVVDGVFKFFAAQFDDVKDKIYDIKTMGDKVASDDTSRWIQFDLYFRNAENADKTVDLTNTLVKAITGQSNLAVRIGFIQAKTTLSTATVNAAPWANNDGETGVIFEPNAGTHTTAGEIDYETNYAQTVGESGEYAYKALVAAGATGVYYDRYSGESYTLVTRDGVITQDGTYYVLDSSAKTKVSLYSPDNDYIAMKGTEAAAEKSANSSAQFYTKSDAGYTIYAQPTFEPNETYYLLSYATVYQKANASVLSANAVETVISTSAPIFELKANTISKVSVFIWIEGQDADCTNYVAGNPFSVDLVFNAREKTQGN